MKNTLAYYNLECTQIFAGKTRSISFVCGPVMGLGRLLNLVSKDFTRVKVSGSEKHSSLLQFGMYSNICGQDQKHIL
jgi:hypothetical protein